MRRLFVSILFVHALSTIGTAAEFTMLSQENWRQFSVRGKEADAIYGDFVLRNDRIAAVIAAPVPRRNANMTVRSVGWMVIDLSQRERPNDQLSAFYPGSLRYAFTSPESIRVQVNGSEPQNLEPNALVSGETISVTCTSDPVAGRPDVSIRYTLRDGDPFILIETIFHNDSTNAYTEELSDTMRADNTFAFAADNGLHAFFANDDWFRQAYAVVAPDCEISHEGTRGVVLRYTKAGSNQLTAGQGTTTFARKLLPARSLLEAMGTVESTNDTAPLEFASLVVQDKNGPVRQAAVTVLSGELQRGSGRTTREGRLSFPIAAGEYDVLVQALGRPEKKVRLELPGDGDQTIELDSCGYVAVRVTNESQQPIPCKVSFHGFDGTEDPYFGPTSAVKVNNVVYSANGRFRQEIGPGKYHVIISYGPEHDAHLQDIDVRAGEVTRISARLRRTVDTTGWVSADFHSHSSPSGDNTCSQRARVLNLLCEHLEFAPCTEHNRIDSYVNHLKALEVEHLMATCSGMELTGQPLPINHQNAFPLRMRRRTQDNGAPSTHENPIVQIERLAMWDDGSDKLVQINHPNLVQMIGDRDEDGMADGGFAKMFDYMDVIEVHPLDTILIRPGTEPFAQLERNPVFHWMQMLNLGYRVTGVVNTDAHYSFHGSGHLRNFIRSATDDPAQIQTTEMVERSTRGNLIMTTGPFMEVAATAGAATAGPGEDLSSSSGEVQLHVRVQCPNWFDINRVQVFVNGRLDDTLNFTRSTHADQFTDGVVKFDSNVPVKLNGDAHLIVCAAGEGLKMGPAMGPRWGEGQPIAVSNPIYVDVDGAGFKANGDQLDVPLPIEKTALPRR